MASGPTSPPSPAALDPPFRGHIETTYDALLVFEAARRGMIPRVTRRLIERERGMIQSGAVFVFDEHESGIKRWTDGMIWSPSRILGNFLVYRETDKRPTTNPTSAGATMGTDPNQTSPNSYNQQLGMMSPTHQMLQMPEVGPALGQGALRPRSASETGSLNRHRERQLVGSLTSTYKFKEDGLVKKTMSVHVNGFAQHMISYYTLDDVLTGKLRTPSSLPELASLEISPDYLNKTNFRFPPQVEVGMDGVPRYRGEPEETTTHAAAAAANGMAVYGGDQYDYGQPQQMRSEYTPSSQPRRGTMPMPIPMSSPVSASYVTPGSAGSTYYDQMSPVSQSHMRPGHSMGAPRPGSRSARYDPYSTASPRSASSTLHPQRRPSASHPHDERPGSNMGPSQEQMAYYQQYDVKPVPGSNGQYHYPEYGYSAPSSAPPAHAWPASPVQSNGNYSTPYSGWSSAHPSRLSATVPRNMSGPSAASDMPPHLPPTPHHPGSSATGSPPGVQGYQIPAPPGQEWNGGPAPSGWDQNHMHGPGPFQPPPTASSTAAYQAPPPPAEWRNGASIS